MRNSLVSHGNLLYPFLFCSVIPEKILQLHQCRSQALCFFFVKIFQYRHDHTLMEDPVVMIGLFPLFRKGYQYHTPVLFTAHTVYIALFDQVDIAIVNVPTVTERLLATADIFLGFPIPIASITCMSFTEISLYSEVISALSSISMISLNRFTKMSFTVSTEFIADSFRSTFLYYTPNLPDHKVFFAVLAEVCYND